MIRQAFGVIVLLITNTASSQQTVPEAGMPLDIVSAAPVRWNYLDIMGSFQDRLKSEIETRNKNYLEESRKEFENYLNLEMI